MKAYQILLACLILVSLISLTKAENRRKIRHYSSLSRNHAFDDFKKQLSAMRQLIKALTKDVKRLLTEFSFIMTQLQQKFSIDASPGLRAQPSTAKVRRDSKVSDNGMNRGQIQAPHDQRMGPETNSMGFQPQTMFLCQINSGGIYVSNALKPIEVPTESFPLNQTPHPPGSASQPQTHQESGSPTPSSILSTPTSDFLEKQIMAAKGLITTPVGSTTESIAESRFEPSKSNNPRENHDTSEPKKHSPNPKLTTAKPILSESQPTEVRTKRDSRADPMIKVLG